MQNFLRFDLRHLRMLRLRRRFCGVGNAGTAVRAMRKAQKLSIRQLAELAEVNATMLSQVERGKREPSPRWLKAVTDALGRNLSGAA